jgi:type IV secretory pathway TraG/TraD family ATPase VirD4
MGAIGTDTIYDNTPYPREIIVPDDFRHTYICGMTGAGKSTLLKNLIDFRKGTCVIDFHGDLVEELLDYIPPERINATIYFNPMDIEYPMGFNPLQGDDKSLIAQGIIYSLKAIFDETWGASRLQYILNNTLLSLLEYRHGTFLGINRILSDAKFRNKIIGSTVQKTRRHYHQRHPKKNRNPAVMSFWRDEFEKWNDRYRTEAIAPIQNKVGQFLSDPMMRNILGQVQSSFSIKDIIRRGQILLVNLSKANIGQENARLLGGLLISQFHISALSVRTPYYLFIDEFQNSAIPPFEDILSEARKFKLNLTISHQYIDQVPEGIRQAVFGNVGTLIALKVGAKDGEYLFKEFQKPMNVDYHQARVRIQDSDYLVKLYPFKGEKHGHGSTIIKQSRQRATPRRDVDARIRKWFKN